MNFEAVPIKTTTLPRLSAKLPLQNFAFDRIASAPRVALYKSWSESMESGWTRWTLDQHGLKYDTIKDARMRQGNLRRDYDVLLIQTHPVNALKNGRPADRYPAEYAGGLGTAGLEAIKQFVNEGGRLVTIEESTELAIELFNLGVKNSIAGLRNTEFYVPGSIIAIEGPAKAAWFSDASRAFDVTDPSIKVLTRFGTPLSGWLLGADKLTGKAAAVEANVGRGSVVLFGFQPDYRSQTVATWPMLFDAMMVKR